MVMKKHMGGMWLSNGVVCAIKDVSTKGTNYLIVGAIAITIFGTALPILFFWKDL
jgi:hypothetical protein